MQQHAYRVGASEKAGEMQRSEPVIGERVRRHRQRVQRVFQSRHAAQRGGFEDGQELPARGDQGHSSRLAMV